MIALSILAVQFLVSTSPVLSIARLSCASPAHNEIMSVINMSSLPLKLIRTANYTGSQFLIHDIAGSLQKSIQENTRVIEEIGASHKELSMLLDTRAKTIE